MESSFQLMFQPAFVFEDMMAITGCSEPRDNVSVVYRESLPQGR